MKYGCARVSTEDQNPAMQLAALKKAGSKVVMMSPSGSDPTADGPVDAAVDGALEIANGRARERRNFGNRGHA